jgi:Right handed beta helix region
VATFGRRFFEAERWRVDWGPGLGTCRSTMKRGHVAVIVPSNRRLNAMKKWRPILLPLLAAAVVFGYVAAATVWRETGRERAARPCQGLVVGAGEDLAAVANAAPLGTTFCISGFHRLSGEIVPKDGQRFIGVGWPVLSGSRPLTSFEPSDGTWVIAGQTQDFTDAEPKIADELCMDGYEGCRFPEDIYVDDEFLHQVLSLEELAPGTFFFDYEDDAIHLAGDPTGHEVEASVVRRAFANYEGADDVVIRGLVIEKFSAYSGESGVVGAFNGSNWIVVDNEIRLNHGSAIMVSDSDGMTVRGNSIHHNGCGGIMGAGAASMLIEGNDIAYNNVLNYQSYAWSCGGGKLVRASDVVLQGNRLHDNNGYGFWTDGLNVDVTYVSNSFEDNLMGGLLHEINDGKAGPTTIRDNVFRRNGFGHPGGGVFGAAIVVSASNHVEIVGNTLLENAGGITLNYTPRSDHPDSDLTVHDVAVWDNLIGLPGAAPSSEEGGQVGFYTSALGAPMPTDITFAENRYFLGDPARGAYFGLPDPVSHATPATAAEWQTAGFDASSRFGPMAEFPPSS